jgi:hypothetical protein
MITLEEVVNQLEGLNPESLAQVRHYIGYLKWKQGVESSRGTGQPWAFDFVEHFRRAMVTADYDPSGMEVQIGEAACDGDQRMALWQHPPVSGSAVVEYQVPVPADVTNLQMQFGTGIRDGSQLATGNVVAFRVFVNGFKIWSDTQHARNWLDHKVAMPTIPGDIVRIQFVTDGLGNHQWAWAAWGEPRLVGQVAA